MDLFYPDKPKEQFRKDLSTFDDENGDWEGTLKEDGWRTLIARDSRHKIAPAAWAKEGDLFFLSRRNKEEGGPTQIPVSDKIVQTIKSLDMPDQSMLDAEWMARRTIGEILESIFLLDLLWWDDVWQGDDRYSRRKEAMLGKLPFNIRDENGFVTYFINDVVSRPACTYERYSEFFEWGQQYAHAEGVVFKHVMSKVKGDRRGCQKNPLWIKIRWRAGDNGRTEVKL